MTPASLSAQRMSAIRAWTFAMIGCHLVCGNYDRKAAYLHPPSACPKTVGADYWLTVMANELLLYFQENPGPRPRVLFVRTDNMVRQC